MRYYLHTFGCKVNYFDSRRLSQALEARYALTPAPGPETADLVLVNTCTVTHKADAEARRWIRRTHRAAPRSRIVVCGCYARRDGEGLAALPEVAGVVDNLEEEGFLTGLADLLALEARREPADPFHFTTAWDRTRAFLKVQDGCNQRCAFCIIPTVRGASRSVPPHLVREAADHLGRQGYRELVLTGINLGTYGWDLTPRAGLAPLLASLVRLPTAPRLRVSSLEPNLFSPALVDLVTAQERIAPHFHVPLQAGADSTLRRMRRPYTAREYARLLTALHRRRPDAALGADVMVGFPGETEAEFAQTAALIEGLPLTYLHVFPSPPRPDTPAAAREPLDPAALKARTRALRDLSDRKRLAFWRRFLGQRRPALVLHPREDGWEALTDNYLRVRLAEDGLAANQEVEVEITGVGEETATGRVAPPH